VFANEVYDAPAAVPLLDMCESERGHLGPPQAASEENGDNGPVAQALCGRNIGRAACHAK